MFKLTTPVQAPRLPFSITLKDKVAVFGSCLADDMGAKLRDGGFGTMVNPFGTLYNPLSVESALGRLDSGRPFTIEDCVQMGAGAGLVCSWEHYTKFARPTADEFLAGANAALAEASEFWGKATVAVVILYTARVWEHDGHVVTNCLKRPASEFTRRLLSPDEVAAAVTRIERAHPDKRFVWMVCPIRQMGDGPLEGSLSKASLHLGLAAAGAAYFPAYEIVHDELRDYRFYAEDLLHPSPVALQILWERFEGAALDPAELSAVEANEKQSKSLKHLPNR